MTVKCRIHNRNDRKKTYLIFFSSDSKSCLVKSTLGSYSSSMIKKDVKKLTPLSKFYTVTPFTCGARKVQILSQKIN